MTTERTSPENRRLTIGSGPHYAEGWTNVDIYPPPEGCRPPDFYVSVFRLLEVFEPGSFDQVYLGHVLEHLKWEEIPLAFAAIRAVAVQEAEVMAVGPCILKAVETRQPVSILEAILADPSSTLPPGAGHAWTPTEDLTVKAMRDQGGLYEVTAVPVAGVRPPLWPNPSTAPWQAAVTGLVP